MIAAVSHNNIALPIHGDAAPTIAKLPWISAFAAHGAHLSAVAHTKHLNTAVVMHEHIPAAIDCNARGILELPISSASAADGSHVAAVAVAQHLHSIIAKFRYDNVACTVPRDARGTEELPSA
jgi:hypothetical protein